MGDIPGDGEEGETGEVSREDLERLLSNERRRQLLYYLLLETPPVPLADVAHRIFVWDDADSQTEPARRRLHIYMSLYHDHLPELVDAGLVEYSQEADTVDLGPTAPHVVSVLEREFEDEFETFARRSGADSFGTSAGDE